MEDDPRSGRPAEATISIQVAAVQRLVEEDGRVTVLQIAEVGSSSGSVSSILHKFLGISKVSAGWFQLNKVAVKAGRSKSIHGLINKC